MITVNYVGYGTRQTRFSEAVKKICINNDDPKENGCFYLPPEYAKMLEIHNTADVSYLFFENRTNYDTLRLNITDEGGNPAPIEIKKGQDAYHENGNRLKLYFDDAPPTDITPTEKALSETERTTLLKMIYGMAIDGYGFNPEEKKPKLTGQTSEGLSAQLLDVGIDVSYKSVKRHIDAAKELFESERKDKCTQKN